MTLKLSIILAVIACCGPVGAAKRPNILWITSEDNGADLGSYGFDYAHTPALDILAGWSAIYSNAFATAAGKGKKPRGRQRQKSGSKRK